MITDKESLKVKHAESAGAIAYISVFDNKGEKHGIGTAFHIGNGLFVTAKHVVEGKEVVEVATTKRAISKYRKQEYYAETKDYINPQRLKVIDGPKFSVGEDSVDVAVFKVEFSGNHLPRLKFDSYTSHDIDDTSYLLDNVLVIGYPPIPFSVMPIQIASLGQVNAVIDVRHSKHPHFIISSLARGGYSGGPVLSEDGKVIGIVTESLVHNNNLTESGFMSILCAEAVILEIQKHYKFDTQEHGVYWEYELMVDIKLRNPKKDVGDLNVRIPDATINVCDIDPDACGHIECDDPEMLAEAAQLMESLCSIDKWDEHSGNCIYSFYSYSYGETLKNAAFAVKDFFIENGYVEISEKDSFEICD